jgi:hypothetical protein
MMRGRKPTAAMPATAASEVEGPRLSLVPALRRHGIWIIAGTRLGDTYPCRCGRSRKCDPQYCPCWSRTDAEAMPSGCCAKRRELRAVPDEGRAVA